MDEVFPLEDGVGLNVVRSGAPDAPVTVVLAHGYATADSKTFEVSAVRGSTVNGICSTPFLEEAFRTDSFRIEVTINPDDTWSYFEDTVLVVKGQGEFHHTDRNTLTRVGAPKPNPITAAG